MARWVVKSAHGATPGHVRSDGLWVVKCAHGATPGHARLDGPWVVKSAHGATPGHARSDGAAGLVVSGRDAWARWRFRPPDTDSLVAGLSMIVISDVGNVTVMPARTGNSCSCKGTI
jgi:hypothetical protein